MATQKKIIEMIGSIKTIYPYYAKDTDVENLVKTWTVLLKDFPDDVTEAAFFKCLQTCKMPPTPADVIENINAFCKAKAPSPEELWDTYYRSLRETDRQVYAFRYTYIDETGMSQGDRARQKVEEIWNGLPAEIKTYLATKGELIRKAQSLCGAEDYEWEKKTFVKNLPIIEKRLEYSGFALSSGSTKFMLGE